MVFSFGGTKYDDNYNTLQEESGGESVRESGLNNLSKKDTTNLTIDIDTANTKTTTTTTTTTPPNNRQHNSCRAVAAVLFAFAALVFLYGFGMSFIGYPDNYTSNYDLLPGQSVRVDSKVNELWYKRAHVYSRDKNPGTMGVFYYSDCPAPDLTRKTSFSTRLDDRRIHRESFYLLKGTSFDLTWTTSENTTLYFYKHPETHYHFHTTREEVISFEMTYSGWIYLDWIPDLASSRFQGSALFDFHLVAYDHSKADNVCVLDGTTQSPNKCSVSTTDSPACAILDIIDFSPTTSTPRTPNSTVTTLNFTKDGGKYFLIVPFPILIIFLFCMTISVYLFCFTPTRPAPTLP